MIHALVFAACFALAPPDEPKVTLIAVGDVCLARGVESIMAMRGRGYPFAAMKNELRRADIAFCNLECCIALSGEAVPKKYNFRARPHAAVALREAGFDVVSLANNHSEDFGREALAETIRRVRAEGIQTVGAGLDPADAHALRIVNVRGLRVGFLAYLGLFPPILPNRDGEPAVAMADMDVIGREVKAARSQVDVLVISLHAGKEYSFRHNRRQREIAHAAIDSGADMVIGHHPHVVQDSEVYKGRPIFYSLGNFVFDPSPAFITHPEKRWSAMVVAELSRVRPPKAQLVELQIVDRQPQRKR